MKINFELEVGCETAIVLAALESQLEVFSNHPDKQKIKLYVDVSQRLINTLVAKTDIESLSLSKPE